MSGIWPILWPPRQAKLHRFRSLQRRQQITVPTGSETPSHMNPKVWIHSDEMGIERFVVKGGHADSVADGSWPSLRVGDDVRSYKKFTDRKAAEGAAIRIG